MPKGELRTMPILKEAFLQVGRRFFSLWLKRGEQERKQEADFGEDQGGLRNSG